jgi:hypothetical protein
MLDMMIQSCSDLESMALFPRLFVPSVVEKLSQLCEASARNGGAQARES